ncbi:ribonuclease HII, partial [Bifidobacteriaceae bacterium WP022]
MPNKSSNIPLVPSFKYEQDLLCEGYDWVIGLDEVGRGSLAGPVMVGAVVIGIKQVKENYMPEGLADSKLLSEKRREELYEP